MSDCFVLYLLLICMKKKKSGAGKFTNNSSGCGKFLATCKEVISLNIICPKCRTVTIADLKSGELKTIRDRRKNQI